MEDDESYHMYMETGSFLSVIPPNYYCHWKLNITKKEFYRFYVWRKDPLSRYAQN
jgi:hypothetical protein